MNMEDRRPYLGSLKQLFRADEYRLVGGTGDGMRMFHVHNGAEMEFVCSVDRCMDLHYLRCKGYNLGFLTGVGDVAPQYYDDRGLGWMKSFTAGFMTTCGLQTTGLPSRYEGRDRGLHGRISNCPAEEAGIQVCEEHDGVSVQLRGVMREYYPTGENLTLTRTIRAALEDRTIRIRDVVRNQGYRRELHMMLYHFNLGYSLLSERTQLLIPAWETLPRDRDAADHPTAWREMAPPTQGLPEMCYYHRLRAGEDGRTLVAAFNPDIGVGVAIRFDRRALDRLVQWRQLTAGYYAMGLEPCNATIDGVEDAIQNGSAKFLDPGEEAVYELEIELITDRERFEALEAESARYQ